jgi:hypothetical protein
MPHGEAQRVFVGTHALGLGDVEQGYQEDFGESIQIINMWRPGDKATKTRPQPPIDK